MNSKYALNETGVLQVRDANDQPIFATKNGAQVPVTITVVSRGTMAYARAETARTNRMTDRIKRKGKQDVSAEELIGETAEFLASCTVAMDNIDEVIGATELQGKALFKSVYSDLSIRFVADQVNRYMSDDANFSSGPTGS